MIRMHVLTLVVWPSHGKHSIIQKHIYQLSLPAVQYCDVRNVPTAALEDHHAESCRVHA